MAQFKALIIDKPEWDLMVALDPHFAELSFEENQGRFLVLDYTSNHSHGEPVRWMIVTPDTFNTLFDHFVNAEPIRTYTCIE